MSTQDVTAWFEQVPGQGLLALEQEQVNKWMPLVRGATVLQLGGLPGQFQAVSAASKHYHYMMPSGIATDPGVSCAQVNYAELPLSPDSVDLVLLVHVLELVEHPSVLLKEVFDALAPNGKLLLFCMNAWSLGGLQQQLRRAPACYTGARFHTPAHLQQWLSSLGFSTLKDKTLGFRSLHNQRPVTSPAVWLETLGQLTVPMLGAVNVFLVEKRVYAGLASLRYHWQHDAQQA